MSNPLHKKMYSHILDEDVIAATTDRRPSLARDKRQAQLILQENGETGLSVYEHVSTLLKRILEDRPPNVIDYFEEYSRQVRSERINMNENRLRPTYIEPERLAASQFLLPLLRLPPPEDFPGRCLPRAEEEAEEEEELFDPPITDVMHLQFYWNLSGYGFPPGHIYILSCCMQKFIKDHTNVVSCSFWGQLYGTEKNYYVLEADLTVEEIDERATVEMQRNEEDRNDYHDYIGKLGQTTEISKDLEPHRPSTPTYATPYEYPPPKRNLPPTPVLPPSMFQRKPDIPPEVSGTGVNRKTYFVCNRLGEKWVELPTVTPQQIQVSRQIRKFLTGNLNAELWSYPIFPGAEKHYLRAIVTRITCATFVAPAGYYRVGGGADDEEEEVDEEENNNDKVTSIDPGYEPLGAKDLLELQNWTHYRPHILKQGRVRWFNPRDLLLKDDEEEEEEVAEEDEEEEHEGSVEKEEIGPTLLTPCSEDTTRFNVPWSTRLAHNFNPTQTMVVIRSNVWPGAFSFAQLRNHGSLYVGWGVKTVVRNYSQIAIPGIESEYLVGPEVMEINDPTVQDEEDWRIAHTPKIYLDEEEGEEEEEEEEGGGGEFNEDDE